MPPQPARIELVSASSTAWSQASVSPVAPLQSKFVPIQSHTRGGLQAKRFPTSPTVSPLRGGAAASVASPTMSMSTGFDKAATGVSAAAPSLPTSAAPTMLETFLQRLSIADRALPTLMMFAGRRRARKTFATVGEWRLSRDMDHLIVGTANTALRDAIWRWKLLQSFVLRQDCVSSYRPPLRHSYNAVVVRSRLPPPAPRVPHAEELKMLSLEQAVDHLHRFEGAMSDYLRTTWVPEDTEHVPRSVEQVRQQSEKRMCALLELPDASVLHHTRLGAAMALRTDTAMDKADALLLSKERATSALLIRPQFVMKKSEREEMDPRVRLQRMQRYGWQVRERLFVPSALQDLDMLDAEVHATVAALTPRERARSALLDVAPLEQVVGRERLQESIWACDVSTESSASDFGPTQPFGGGYGNAHSSPSRWNASTGASPQRARNTDSVRTEAPHSHHVLDFSFCDLESFHQLLFVQPRKVGDDGAPTGAKQPPAASQRPPSPSSLHTRPSTSQSRHGSISGGGSVSATGGAQRSLMRRGTMRRTGGGAQSSASPNSPAHRAVVQNLRLRHVFCEKDDNAVQLEQMATELIERSQSPLLMRAGQSFSGGRRRSSTEMSGGLLHRGRTGSVTALDLYSRNGSIDPRDGVPASEPSRLSPRMVTIADKRDLVARKGIAADLLAYVDHPSIGQYLSINQQHEVRPSSDARRFPALEVHELKLNDNHLGAPVAKLSTKHRVLAEDDGRRGSRNDPDVTLWKQLVQLASEEAIQKRHQATARRGSEQPLSQVGTSAVAGGRQKSVAVDGTRFAALFIRCLTLTSAAETITVLDLSGNAFDAVPIELVGQLRGLKQLKLHKNRIASLHSVAALCGLLGGTTSLPNATTWERHNERPTSSRLAVTPKEYRPSRTKHFPSIRFQLTSLSLHGNPVQETYGLATYRGFLLTAFPNVRTLDAAAVTLSEVEELWSSAATFYI